MSEPLSKTEEIILETKLSYDRIVRQTLTQSKLALDRAIEFRKKYNCIDDFPSNAEFTQYLRDVCEAKFGRQPAKGLMCWIDPEVVHDLFEKIEADPRVKFFAKDMGWTIIDWFGYMRTCGEVLNYYFPVNVNRKNTNRIYRRFLISQGAEGVNDRMPYGAEKRRLAIEEHQKKRDEFRQQLAMLNLPGLEELGFNFNEMIDAAVSGDLRRLQTLAFPILAQSILLQTEIEKGKVDENLSMVRATLMFDVYRLLSPERRMFTRAEFDKRFIESKNTFYDGNYSLYQRDYLRTLLGA